MCSAADMGLLGFLVELDSSSNTFYSGSEIRGKVIIRLDKPKTVRGIRMEITGVAKTEWSRYERRDMYGRRTYGEENREYRNVYFSGEEYVFYQVFYIVGGTDERVELKVGYQEYPFKTTLAISLPSSHEGSDGSIRYSIKAILDRPWKHDNKVFLPLTVVKWVDLNSYPATTTAVTLEDEKTYGCLCCKAGPLVVKVTLPQTGYVPGEVIAVSLKVKNTSRVRVASIDVDLQKNLEYVASYPESDRKSESFAVASLTLPGVEPMQTKSYTPQLTVPYLYPGHCTSFVSVTYELLVTAAVSGLRRNLVLRIPIFIGTVPVTRPPSPFDAPTPSTLFGFKR